MEAKQYLKPYREDGRNDKSLIYALFALNAWGLIALDTSVIIDFGPIVDYSVIFIFFIWLIYGLRLKYRSSLLRLSSTLFFVVVSTFLVLSSIKLEVFYLQRVFKGIYYFLPYFFPIILLTRRYDYSFIIKMLDITRRLIPLQFLMMIYVFLNLDSDLSDIHYLLIRLFSGANTLLLLSNLDQFKSYKYLVFLLFVGSLIVSIMYDRRTWFLVDLMYISFFLWVNLKLRLRIFLISIIVPIVSLLSIGSLINIANFSEVSKRGLDLEGFEQSRSLVFEHFVSDFTDNGGWFIGRGLNGEVDRPKLLVKDGKSDYIENGYLTYILKGGWVFLTSFISLMSFSIIRLLRAKFRYTDKFALHRGMAAYVFIHLIGMIGFNVPVLHFDYLVLFIYAGYSAELNMI